MAESLHLFCTGHACPAINKMHCQQNFLLRFRYLFVDLKIESVAGCTCKHAVRDICPCLYETIFLMSWKIQFLCVLHVSTYAIQLVPVGRSLKLDHWCTVLFYNQTIQCLVFSTRLAQIVPSDVIQGIHGLV